MWSAAALADVDHPHSGVKAALQRIYAMHRKSVGLRLHDTVFEQVLERLGRPQDRLPPVIHLAGTNGKGSTAAILGAIYEAAGYRVHAYTSPHIFIFNERIRLAGACVSDDLLLATITRLDVVLADLDDTISFFEYTTALALLLFAEIPADVCLLETGMGGRLDPTNIVPVKAVTILTKISYDHMRFLGNTLGAIAGEKSAIMRPNTPCVVAPQFAPDEVLPVMIETAIATGTELQCAGSDWCVHEEDCALEFTVRDWTITLPRPALLGAHQIENAGNALMAVHLLQSCLPVSVAEMGQGLVQAEWPARLQRIDNVDLVGTIPAALWYDGAHNDTGALAMAAQCAVWQAAGKTVHLVVALGAGKNAGAFVAPFLPYIASLTFLDLPVGHSPRLASAMAAEYHGTIKARCAATPAAALQNLQGAVGSDAVVLFCGSLYFASRVLV